MVIGHLPQGIVRVYNLHDRLEQRREALAKWGRHVKAMVEGDGKVVPLRARRA